MCSTPQNCRKKNGSKTFVSLNLDSTFNRWRLLLRNKENLRKEFRSMGIETHEVGFLLSLIFLLLFLEIGLKDNFACISLKIVSVNVTQDTDPQQAVRHLQNNIYIHEAWKFCDLLPSRPHATAKIWGIFQGLATKSLPCRCSKEWWGFHCRVGRCRNELHCQLRPFGKDPYQLPSNLWDIFVKIAKIRKYSFLCKYGGECIICLGPNSPSLHFRSRCCWQYKQLFRNLLTNSSGFPWHEVWCEHWLLKLLHLGEQLEFLRRRDCHQSEHYCSSKFHLSQRQWSSCLSVTQAGTLVALWAKKTEF